MMGFMSGSLRRMCDAARPLQMAAPIQNAALKMTCGVTIEVQLLLHSFHDQPTKFFSLYRIALHL